MKKFARWLYMSTHRSELALAASYILVRKVRASLDEKPEDGLRRVNRAIGALDVLSSRGTGRARMSDNDSDFLSLAGHVWIVGSLVHTGSALMSAVMLTWGGLMLILGIAQRNMKK